MKRSELIVVLWAITIAFLFAVGVAIWSPPLLAPYGTTLLRRPFHHERGNAYRAEVFLRDAKADEEANMNQSTLQLYEDGNRLGPQHNSSDDVARQGRGLYLFWRSDSGKWIIFSTSDNSDPNTNGRTYSVSDPQVRDPYEKNLWVR
jgi:hypothetical protein